MNDDEQNTATALLLKLKTADAPLDAVQFAQEYQALMQGVLNRKRAENE